MSANPRRKARVVALQALYEADMSNHEPLASLQRVAEAEGLSEAQREFAQALVERVTEGKESIDEMIGRAATQWPVSQLSAVDRNILRLAIAEILMDNGAPIRVAINEAVELAKSFGSDSSAKFVNGVLGAVSLSLAP